MSDESKSPSFWTTFPGIVTAVAGLVTALTGLLVGLNQTGVIGGDKTPADTSPPVVTASSRTPSASGASAPGAEGDALGGTWRGTAAEPDGSGAFEVRLEIVTPCRLREPCGTIAVSSPGCTGRATLWGVRASTYEFYVDEFTGDSSPGCNPGPGDFFRKLDDGTLRYTRSYDHVVGALRRTG